MALPKRLYIVKVGPIYTEPYPTLKQALEEVGPAQGRKFSYRVYEGSNSVECEALGGVKFRERRK